MTRPIPTTCALVFAAVASLIPIATLASHKGNERHAEGAVAESTGASEIHGSRCLVSGGAAARQRRVR
jgi:hypothetical protein